MTIDPGPVKYQPIVSGSGIFCVKCRYSLDGLRVEDACPECGVKVRTTLEASHGLLPETSSVKCSKCGFPLAGRFTRHSCPNCQLLIGESMKALLPPPLTLLQKQFVVAYCVVWFVLIARSNWENYLPFPTRSAITPFEFSLIVGLLTFGTSLCGIVLGCVLMTRKQWFGVVIFVSAFLLLLSLIFG